jgi:hypothetical protein
MAIHEICLNFKEKILHTDNNSLSKLIPISKIQDTFINAFNMDKNEAKKIIKSLDEGDENLIVEEDKEENVRYVISYSYKQYMSEKTDVFMGNKKKYVIFNKMEDLVIVKDIEKDLLLLKDDETYTDIVSFNKNQYLYKITPYALTSDLYNLIGSDGNKLKITKKKDYTISLFNVTDEIRDFIKKNEYFSVIYEIETEQIYMDKENYVRFDPYEETREYICPCNCRKKIKVKKQKKKKAKTLFIEENENTEMTGSLSSVEEENDNIQLKENKPEDEEEEIKPEIIEVNNDLILPTIYFHYTKHKGIFAGFVTNNEIIDDEKRIIKILHNAYRYNLLFYTHLMTNQYNYIKVIRNLHYDKYVHDKTYHFNIVLESTNKTSPVLHAYVENEEMTRLTVVTDILSCTS